MLPPERRLVVIPADESWHRLPLKMGLGDAMSMRHAWLNLIDAPSESLDRHRLPPKMGHDDAMSTRRAWTNLVIVLNQTPSRTVMALSTLGGDTK